MNKWRSVKIKMEKRLFLDGAALKFFRMQNFNLWRAFLLLLNLFIVILGN